jgi:hypothetical protein
VSIPPRSHLEYTAFSSISLRNTLASKMEVYKRRYGSLLVRPQDPLDMYNYYTKRYLAVQLLLAEYKKFYPKQAEDNLDDEGRSVLISLVISDMNSFAMPGACAVWLTWDDWTPAKSGIPEEEIPEGLSYGLVLSYPRPIMRMACFLSGLTTREELVYLIPQEVQQTADKFALQQLRDFCRDFSEEQIEHKLRLVRKQLTSEQTKAE